jgi:hypothetical protein
MQKWQSEAVIWRPDNRQHNSQKENEKTTIVVKAMHWKLRLKKNPTKTKPHDELGYSGSESRSCSKGGAQIFLLYVDFLSY